MPMDDASLATLIQSQLMAAFGQPADPVMLQKFSTAIATAVVEYLKASATIQGTVISGAGSGGQIQGTVT